MGGQIDTGAILSGMFIPASITGTAPTTPRQRKSGVTWNEGADRDLRHNCWRIVTADPQKKRLNVYFTVSFDSAVGFPNVKLSDANFDSDRLTKKLLILKGLTIGTSERGREDAHTLLSISHRFDWVLRYREAEGVERFAAIPDHFCTDLAETLSRGGLLALVPIERRLLLLSENRFFDVRKRIFKNGKVSWTILANTLGVTRNSIERSEEFRVALVEIFGLSPDQIGLEFAPKRLENIYQDDEVAEKLAHSTSVPRIVSDNPVTVWIERYLRILEMLAILSRNVAMQDKLTADPFKEASIDALVARFGVKGGRTPTLMPEDLLRVMVAAGKWIKDYGREICSALRDQRSRAPPTADKSVENGVSVPSKLVILPVWSVGRSQMSSGQITLTKAIRFLLASCAILIACFAARRNVGVQSLKAGCLLEGEEGVLQLSVYIAKTDMDLAHIPVPSLVKMVIETLEKLSADTRQALGTGWLFEIAFNTDAQPPRFVSTNFYNSINEFLEFVGLPPPDGQSNWQLAMHQFRRGYGVWYYFGLRGSNADALSFLYKHRDPRMTRVYFTLVLPGEINRIQTELDARLRSAAGNRSEELQTWVDAEYERLSYLREHHASWNEPRCELFVSKMIAIWKGTETVIGAGGKRLFNDVMSIADRVAATIRIGSRLNDPSALEAPLQEQFWNHARRNFLEPVLDSNMWCTARPEDADLSRANCLTLKGRLQAPWRKGDAMLPHQMVDFDFASNRVCADCFFCAAFRDGQKALRREIQAERDSANLASTAQLRAEAAARVTELEKAVRSAGLELRGGDLD
ncbi:hypothetical protein ELH99_17610 [Rhizobium leguminosarum]|uniref:hypothetical protein n=1 Tax=Rhizobium leguminosarum TaxID=384 RepID=UPI00102F91FC|nr:hypothetical protein [Rhizobium leguminosarum]TAX51860.1 hypothetical protein ELH99_17610 [Rhizobium leguminosarum]